MGSALHAADNAMQFGQSSLKNAQLDSLHHSGQLRLDNVQFKGTLLVNGQLEATGSTFNDLTVNGNCALKDVKVSGPVNINGQIQIKDSQFNNTLNAYGYLTANKSSFAKTITVDGKTIDLNDSTIQDILVQASFDKVQTMNLENTQIAGNVLFESGQGVIKMDDKSHIAGKVTGARVEKK